MAKLTHEQAMQRLTDASISVYSSGNSSDRNNPNATSLQGVQENTINGIVNFREASGKNIVITGGTETGHAQGSQSHSEGYKLDIRVTPGLSEWIQNNFEYVRDRNNGDPVYRDSLGNEFTFERSRNHWDITFRGQNPEPTEHESNSNQRDAGVPDELEPHYDANPPMGTPPESEPNPPDMGVSTEPNPPDMSAPAESNPSDMGTPTESMPSDMSIPGEGGQAHDAEPNFSLPDGSQISILTDIQNYTPADAGQNLTPVDVGENHTPADANQSVAPPEVNQSIQPPEVNQSMALPDSGYDAGSSSASGYDAGSSDAGGYDGGYSDAGGYDAGSSDASGASEGGAEAASRPG